MSCLHDSHRYCFLHKIRDVIPGSHQPKPINSEYQKASGILEIPCEHHTSSGSRDEFALVMLP